MRQTLQRHKEAKDVVGTLEDAEDAEVALDPLQPGVAHEAHAAVDLDGLVRHVPGALGRRHLCACSLQVVLRETTVHVARQHVRHRLRGPRQRHCRRESVGQLFPLEAPLPH